MKKATLLFVFIGLAAMISNAQLRYKKEVFTDAQLKIEAGTFPFGYNINWIASDQAKLADTAKARVNQRTAEMTYLQTKAFLGQLNTVPTKYYFPFNYPGGLGDSTIFKITALKMVFYMPDVTVDTAKKRPLIIYLHTGNFLPVGTNNSPCGDKRDSSVVDICKGFARRGYVAVAIDYRLGWNPVSPNLDVRRGGLLNAVYRAIHDVKECVRYLRNPNLATVDAKVAGYKIDVNNIALFGEGTGGYLAQAYNTLNRPYEFLGLPKFAGYIDTLVYGNVDGFGGAANLYQRRNIGTKIQVTGNIGGALADSSWLEKGDAPMISMQCVRDPFAPFDHGMVTVPGYLFPVVEVDGANNTIWKAQKIGNNNIFAAIPTADPYTTKARSLYNRKVDYILAPPMDKIDIGNGEGMYPFLLPKAAKQYDNQASPWQWWDSTSAEALTIVPPGVTAHRSSMPSSPGMGKIKSRLYQDTIFGYMSGRFALAMGLLTADQLGIRKTRVTGVSIYPNPATNVLSINYNGVINTVTIIDLSGKTVYQTSVQSNSLTIPLNLSQGLYFVNIATENGNDIQKLVVK